MRREVADPCGWAGQDWDEDSIERTSSRPDFPFTPGSAEEIARKLREIDTGTAVRLLVAHADDWCRITKVPSFSENPEGLLTPARDALSRFGPHFSCYASVAEARVPKSPRLMVDESGPGWTPLTEYRESVSIPLHCSGRRPSTGFGRALCLSRGAAPRTC